MALVRSDPYGAMSALTELMFCAMTVTVHPFPLIVIDVVNRHQWKVKDICFAAQVGDYEFNMDDKLLAVPKYKPWFRIIVSPNPSLMDGIITDGETFYRSRASTMAFDHKDRMQLTVETKEMLMRAITEFMAKSFQ